MKNRTSKRRRAWLQASVANHRNPEARSTFSKLRTIDETAES